MTKIDKVKLIENMNSELSVKKQCKLLNLNRSSYYYKNKTESEENVKLMTKIDKIYTAMPYYGSPKITKELRKAGNVVNHKRVERLMRLMGLTAIFPKRNLSKRNMEHKIFPYLLRDLGVVRANQVWGTDITYIRINGDWIYLVAIIDWFSRFVVSWRLSKSLSSDFCVENLNEALRTAIPEIHNSDQGSQFTDSKYVTILEGSNIKISMDGRGRCFDNIFTERLWRTVKYEEVYIKDYESFEDAESNLAHYFDLYNHRRLHQSLDYQTPAEVYFTKTQKVEIIKNASFINQFPV